MNTPPIQWPIPVLDAHKRERTLIVTASSGNVVLLPPPGEACILPPGSDDMLCDAILEARLIANETDSGTGASW